MPLKPILFVSHSSADTPLAEGIVSKIENETNFKAVLDARDLQLASDWRPQLHQWLARCNTGLLLLTDNAIDSNWVLQEATILCARKQQEPEFKVFVVASFDRAKKKERWRLFEPLELDEIQGLRSADEATASAAVIEQLEKLPEASADTYLERLSGCLSDALGEFRDKAYALSVVAEKMELHEAAWEAVVLGKDRCAELIARQLSLGRLGKFGSLRDLIAAFVNSSPPHARQSLLALVGSYWVDVRAACMFPNAAASGPPRMVLIRSSYFHEFSGERYIARHYSPYLVEPEIIDVSGANETGEDISTQIAEHFVTHNRAYMALKARQGIKAVLAKVRAADHVGAAPTFVLLPYLKDENLVLELTSADRGFPGFVFVVPVEESATFRKEWRHGLWVEPEVDEPTEWTRYKDYEAARELANKQN